jgi:hypothetical protein
VFAFSITWVTRSSRLLTRRFFNKESVFGCAKVVILRRTAINRSILSMFGSYKYLFNRYGEDEAQGVRAVQQKET